MKRTVNFFAALICVCTLLCGCGESINLTPAEYESGIEISEDGQVPSSVFAYLKENNKITNFEKTSNGTDYVWTVFGSDIDTPSDTDLDIEIIKADTESILFNYKSDKGMSFSPMLSIKLDCKWDALGAGVYTVNPAGRTRIGDATITGSDSAIVNLSIKLEKGSYLILPDTEEDVLDEAEESAKHDSLINESDYQIVRRDDYLSDAKNDMGQAVTGNAGGEERVLSDGKGEGKDKYLTDPVPEGKPVPVEPETQIVDTSKQYTCTFSIECSTILNNLDKLKQEKADEIPSNGIILAPTTVAFYEGESVYTVLQRVCKENGIQMEASFTPIYNSAYVEGIHNLYEFDCGQLSGWMYRVNGWYPNYGCSRYVLTDKEVVEWRYTCDLGKDVGGEYAVGGD